MSRFRLQRLFVSVALAFGAGVASAGPPPEFTNEPLLADVSQPISLGFLPDGRWLVVQRAGQILLADSSAVPATRPYLALTNVDQGGERGLLDIALDPDFAHTGHFFVVYSAAAPVRFRISRFTHRENAGGLTSSADPASEVVIWQDDEDYTGCCHHGAGLDFGPDGKLYLTLGDKSDEASAQDLTHASGSVIRLNRDGSIPDGRDGWPANPFADGPGGKADGIWAYGLRDPFRARWDLPSGRLFIGEADGDVHISGPNAVQAGVDFGPSTPPVFRHARAGSAAAITGGAVYRSHRGAAAAYHRAYFYADRERCIIGYLTFDAAGSAVTGDHVFDAEAGPVVFLDLGPGGALYYTTSDGRVGRYVPNAPVVAPATAVLGLTACQPVSSGLVLRLEADTGVATSGSNVTSWADQSTSGNDLLASAAPQLVLAGGPNGQPYVSFDGVDDKLERLDGAAAIDGLPAGSANRTAFFVVRYVNAQGDSGGFAYGDGASNAAFGLVASGTSGALTVQGSGAGNDFPSGAAGVGAGWLVQGVVYSSGTIDHFRNGTLIDTDNHAFNTVVSRAVLAQDISSSGFSQLDVAAVFVYDGALSLADRRQVEAYLLDKYLGAPPDQDGDGLDDCADGCPADPGKTAPGVCGCGVSDMDSEGDGLPDCVDPCPYNHSFNDIPDDWDDDGICNYDDICPHGPDVLDFDGDGTPDDCDPCADDANDCCQFSRTWLDFDGTDDRVNIADSDDLDLVGGQFTIEMWIKPRSFANNGRLIDHGGSTSSTGWLVHLSDGDFTLRVPINNDSSYDQKAEPFAVTPGVWNHVAVTFDNGTLTFYSDGVVRGVRTAVPTPLPSTALVRLGERVTSSRNFDGAMDEVRVWSISRTQAEIQSTMHVQLTGNEPGLVMYLPLDEGTGQIVQDSTPHGHDGTLGGTAGADARDPLWVVADSDADGSLDLCDACPGEDDTADGDGDGVPDACDVCAGGDDHVDTDEDGIPDFCDVCPGSSGLPSPVGNTLQLSGPAAATVLDWSAEIEPGPFQLYGGYFEGEFAYDHVCLEESIPGETALDADVPLPGRVLYYLVARVGCGISGLGSGTGGERPNDDPCPGTGQDADGDGTAERLDNCPGLSNSTQADSDADGHGDACDLCPGSHDWFDADSDGVPDGCDVCPDGNDALDSDGDGVANACDVCPGGDDAVDSDGDSSPDHCDVCPQQPLDDCVLSSTWLDFDGVNDYVDVPDSATVDLTGGSFTIEARIRPGPSTDNARIADHNGSSGNGWVFHLKDSDNSLQVQINGATGSAISNPLVITRNAWNHVAVTYGGGTIRFYVNGVAQGVVAGIPAPLATTAKVRIGARESNGTRLFNGEIDELRIWSTTRTQQQLQDNMGSQLVGPQSGLVLYHRYDEGAGQTASDTSGNGNTGLLGSTPGPDANDPAWVN